jgi:hypothetical protein
MESSQTTWETFAVFLQVKAQQFRLVKVHSLRKDVHLPSVADISFPKLSNDHACQSVWDILDSI